MPDLEELEASAIPEDAEEVADLANAWSCTLAPIEGEDMKVRATLTMRLNSEYAKGDFYLAPSAPATVSYYHIMKNIKESLVRNTESSGLNSLSSELETESTFTEPVEEDVTPMVDEDVATAFDSSVGLTDDIYEEAEKEREAEKEAEKEGDSKKKADEEEGSSMLLWIVVVLLIIGVAAYFALAA